MIQYKNQIYNKRNECLLGVSVGMLHIAVLVFMPLPVLNEDLQDLFQNLERKWIIEHGVESDYLRK